DRVRTPWQFEVRIVLIGAQYPDIGETVKLVQARAKPDRELHGPVLADLVPPVGAHDRERDAQMRQRPRDAVVRTIEGPLLAQRNGGGVRQSGPCRSGGGPAGLPAGGTQEREGTVDATGNGEHAATWRRWLGRNDLVGGDPDGAVLPTPLRPDLLEFF